MQKMEYIIIASRNCRHFIIDVRHQQLENQSCLFMGTWQFIDNLIGYLLCTSFIFRPKVWLKSVPPFLACPTV